jgi:Fe-Mn family superoxide dismutase
MSKADKDLVSSLDLVKIVKKSLQENMPGMGALDEAFVATPKHYKQVSEFVSEKTKNSHTELYKQLVETLNKVSSKLDTADRSAANANSSEFRSLKLDETDCLNGVWLHELFFANGFDPNSEIFMDSKAYMKLSEAFGTFDDFQRDLIACAMSSNDGWAITGYNMFLKKIVNTVINDNSESVMMGLYPLIVIDVNEHAYYKDYLTDKKSYVIAIMKQLDWNVVEERFLKMEAIAQAIK